MFILDFNTCIWNLLHVLLSVNDEDLFKKTDRLSLFIVSSDVIKSDLKRLLAVITRVYSRIYWSVCTQNWKKKSGDFVSSSCSNEVGFIALRSSIKFLRWHYCCIEKIMIIRHHLYRRCKDCGKKTSKQRTTANFFENNLLQASQIFILNGTNTKAILLSIC